MAKKQKKKDKKDKQDEDDLTVTRTPWIAYKTGIIISAITSVAMTVLTIVQAIQYGYGILEAIFRGLVFGVIIWAIFFGYLLFTRFLRRL
jgi:hypothetical protein